MEDMGQKLREMMDKRQLNQDFQALARSARNDAQVQAFLSQHPDLTEAEIQRSIAKIYEFVTERDKRRNGETVFAPDYQPKLMLNQRSIDVTYVPTAEFQAKRTATTLRDRVQAINMPKDIRHANFATYDTGGAGRIDALIAAQEFVADLTESPKNFHRGLYLTGTFGVGKTYLLGAIANELAALKINSTLLHFPTFTVDMKNAIGENKVAENIDVIKQAPVLMIDDIGADAMSAWIRDEVLGVILQYRMQEELSTLFTSNLTMAELEHHLTFSNQGDNEPIKAKRIMQRVQFLANEIPMSGPNRRFSDATQ